MANDRVPDRIERFIDTDDIDARAAYMADHVQMSGEFNCAMLRIALAGLIALGLAGSGQFPIFSTTTLIAWALMYFILGLLPAAFRRGNDRSSARDRKREADQRAWNRYRARNEAAFHDYQARKQAGTYEGMRHRNRANAARERAKRY